MNDRYRRIYEAAMRVAAFLVKYYDDLKQYEIVVGMRGELEQATGELTALGADKVTKTAAALDRTIHRGDARDRLTDRLRNIADTWKRIVVKTGGDPNKFRMPRGGDQDIIATAESFAAQAEGVKGEFIRRAFKPDFIDELRAAIALFAQTVTEAETARRERVGTNAAFDMPVKTCKTLIEDFDPIVKLHYRDNPRVLAEWLVASHIERAPHSRTEAKPKES
ncbi:MAG: hypothetical protein JSS81_13050 [Acidobacteria bacterium]|nr:hypothetical protein [Acidobacteriota bacterium]